MAFILSFIFYTIKQKESYQTYTLIIEPKHMHETFKPTYNLIWCEDKCSSQWKEGAWRWDLTREEEETGLKQAFTKGVRCG